MTKYDLLFDPSIMNAAGTLGFTPDPHSAVDLARLGAFVTNPISLAPRTPAHSKRFMAFPGGFLFHTGYPNPGLQTAIRRYASRWARSLLPVLVHLLVQNPDEAARMTRRLENLEGVMGVELSPPPEAGADTILRIIQAAAGELPVIIRLPLEKAVDLAPTLSGRAAAAGSTPAAGCIPAPGSMAAAISLAPPRGALVDPQRGNLTGRLYGPAIFPQALLAVRELKRCGLPVIGAGGLYQTDQVEAMLNAGAIAVQLDSVLWRGEKTF